MFIEINILTFKDIDLIIFIRINYIESCKIIFILLITFLIKPLIKQLIIFEKLIIISIYSYIAVPIKRILLFINNNFISELIENYPVILFIIIINSFFYIILIRNNFDRLI